MAQYMLSAYDRPMPEMSPAEMQAVFQRYSAWTKRMKENGMMVDGFKLKDGEGRCIRKEAGAFAVTDGPFAEAKEVLGGYWLLEAPTYEAVLAELRDHPHLEFGTLELRAIEM